VTAGPQNVVKPRHMPALDGLRAVAVAGVVAYHLGLPAAGGGYLGVDVFFVLSGFLITGLLLGEWSASGRISLRRFWARRARRLLPALVVLLVTLAGVGWAGGTIDRSALRADALSALAYVANWHLISAHQSYFAQFAAPSPLQHTWSLAIEEQFYLAWPLVLIGLLRLGRHRWRALSLGVIAAAVAGSAATMAWLANGSADPSRAYYGTDSRAFELLVGAGLAVLAGRRRRTRSGPALTALSWAGGLGLVAAMTLLSGTPSWMYDGGFLAAAVLAGLVVDSVSRPDPGRLGRCLAARPLRAVGRVSYGLYLWHWPVFVLLSPRSIGLAPALADLARLAVTGALTTASYLLVEGPARRWRPSGWRRRLMLPGTAAATVGAILASTGAVAVAAPAAVRAAPVLHSATAAGGAMLAGEPFALSRSPTGTDPLRVLVIGDSVMNTEEPALAAELQSTGEAVVRSLAFPGWGLTSTTSWRADWPGYIARWRPEVVVGMWSWDNRAAATEPAAYRALLRSALAELMAPGDGVDGVVLLEFPKVGQRDGETPAQMAAVEAQRRAWSDAARAAASAEPARVSFLPLASALEVDGNYSAWLPVAGGGWSRARTVDNTHLCPTGAARLATAFMAAVGPAWHLGEPPQSWLDGPWSADHRYADPAGACPADQPS